MSIAVLVAHDGVLDAPTDGGVLIVPKDGAVSSRIGRRGVRISSLKALSHSKATPALLDIAASLSDPQPDVRHQAITTLTVLSPASPALTKLLIPLLDDECVIDSIRAALSILKSSNSHNERAKLHLRQTAALGNLEERIHAIQAMGEWGDLREAFFFLANELHERQLEPAVKGAILISLAGTDANEALPHLLKALEDPAARETSAQLLGDIAAGVMPPILNALTKEAAVGGALLTLEHLPPSPCKPILEVA